MRFILSIAFALFIASHPTRADWLDNAWSGKSTALYGNPAITVRSDGLSVVLPAETLDEARAERGMTRVDALRAFLDRYSPQCSHVLDLNMARQNLAVELQIQAASSFADLSAASADEMLGAMETIEIAPPSDAGAAAAKTGRLPIPRIAQAFTTLPERFVFTIDYAPEKIVRCVAPEDATS